MCGATMPDMEDGMLMGVGMVVMFVMLIMAWAGSGGDMSSLEES